MRLRMLPQRNHFCADAFRVFRNGLTVATENMQAKDDGTQVTLHFPDWQRITAIQMLLARYLRAVAEPEALE